MSHKPTITDSYKFPTDSKIPTILLGVGVVGLLLSAVGYFVNADQFFFSYLASFVFFTGLGLASIFMVMFHHITRSKWGTVLRRIPESMGANLWIWGIAVIPVLLGMHNLYHWSHADAVAHDHILQAKAPFLNPTFFIIRQVIYFVIWGFVGRKLYQASVELEKTGDWGITTLMRKVSAPAIPLFGFSIAFAGFDWLMSLDPHWFSTMFGVYFFAISFQSFWAILLLMIMFLHSKGILKNTIGIAHIYDLGAWLFAFTVFYAYIAFSQFLLIYYANMPEETLWFYNRLENGFQYIAYGTLLLRFVLPFIVLLNRDQKQKLNVLRFVAIVVVVMHFLEIHWIIKPTMHSEEIHGLAFSWMDLTTFFGLGGMFFWLFFNSFKKNSMVPENDPKLEASLEKSYHQ